MATENKKTIYVVAKGKAITTKKGILADGDEIKKEYITEAAFDAFVKTKHIVKK